MYNSLDNPENLLLHQKIIQKKRFLHQIYENFYEELKKLSGSQKPIIELGSGGGFIKKIIPRATTSDVIKGSGIDMVFSSSKMPFKQNSIGAFVLLNVFHHFNNPYRSLKEMERCLKKGGRIIMIEPYNSLWGRFIYKHFHHEDFNSKATWSTPKKGRLSSANSALLWIVFSRDKIIFEKRFPNLRITKFSAHTPFRYLLSGGLSYPQLIPSLSYPFLKGVESILSPLNKWIGMFATIEIVKTKK